MTRVSGSGASGDGTAEVRVVCADDAPDALALLRLQLSQFAEVEVVEAVPDGARAVEAVMRLRPNLVVLDVAMPVMDGLEAAQHIRVAVPSTRILMLSAFSSDRMRAEALGAGADAYVEKGVNREELGAQLRRLFPTVPFTSAAVPRQPPAAPASAEWTPLERRHRALLDALEEAVLVIGSDGCVREANFAAVTVLGRSTSRLVGAAFDELGLADAQPDGGSAGRSAAGGLPRDRGLAAVRAALRSGRPCSNVPLTVLRPDGSTRWLLCSARQLGDVSAVAAGEVLLSLLDLTEQHAAQRDVLASEHRLRVALQSLPDFFAIYVPRRDDSGRVVDLVYDYVNPAALRVLHRPASEVLGRGLVEVLPSNVELGLFDRYVRVLETGETDRFELPWFDEAGVRGAFFITVVRMHDELLIMARDIAEGRQARKEAARSEQRFRAALDAMLDGVVICTAVRDEPGNIVDFTIDYINSFAEVGGRANEELVGKLFTEAWPGAKIGPTPTFDLYRRVVETGEPLVLDSFHYADVIDGQRVEAWFDLRATKLGDGFIQNFRNATGRVRDQHALAERAAALERSNADLQEFAYAVGHDLSTPLHTVNGFAQLLQAHLGADQDQAVDEALRFIVSGVDRTQRMLTGLLAYSRVDTRSEPRTRVDLQEVLDEVRENLRTQLAETNARVEETGLPVVWADRTQLVQLVQNLVANAVTYVAPGVTPLVRLAGARTQDGWQVTVTDNGVGIPAREREPAFRLFHRLGDVEAHAGTGVGLALCRRIATRHGGRIWLDDGTDGGTCVRFTLPDPRPPTDSSSAGGLAG